MWVYVACERFSSQCKGRVELLRPNNPVIPFDPHSSTSSRVTFMNTSHCPSIVFTEPSFVSCGNEITKLAIESWSLHKDKLITQDQGMNRLYISMSRQERIEKIWISLPAILHTSVVIYERIYVRTWRDVLHYNYTCAILYLLLPS